MKSFIEALLDNVKARGRYSKTLKVDGRRRQSPKFIDELGARYGNLIVVSAIKTTHGTHWNCKCDCGGEIVAKGSYLRTGNTVSCGCRAAEALIQGRITHGLSKIPEYRVWEAALDRCRNPRNKQYDDYGGRGITMCDEWKDFAVFYRDMGPRPSEKYTLERCDNNVGYCPSNCKWATRHENNMNRRRRGTGCRAKRAGWHVAP